MFVGLSTNFVSSNCEGCFHIIFLTKLDAENFIIWAAILDLCKLGRGHNFFRMVDFVLQHIF